MPLCRPTPGTGAAMRRISHTPRTRQRTVVPPTTVTPSTLATSPAEWSRHGATSDVQSLVRAECTDELFTAAATTESRGVLHTDGTVAQDAGRNLLNHFNSAAWLSVLPTLHRRGALTTSDEAGARRYLAGPTYQSLLPWLWESGYTLPDDADAKHAEPQSPGWDCAPSSLQDSIHQRLAALASAPTTARARAPTAPPRAVHTDLLRNAPPSEWSDIVMALLPPTDASSAQGAHLSSSLTSSVADDEAELLARLPQWHQVFFSISSNPALNGTADELATAHSSLLDVLALFYKDATAVQQRVSPPLLGAVTGSTNAVEGGDGSTNAVDGRRRRPIPAVVCSTRMPPILLRRWRRLYRAHGAYLLFSEVFRVCVAGEQSVVGIMAERARETVSSLSGSSAATPLAPPLYTTAVLQDTELFNFYVSIPGRRETHLDWEDQWQWTLSYAYVAFRWLFRTQSLALVQKASGARPHQGRQTGSRHGDTADDASQAVKQALSTLLNVAVWVRNNNDEGDRCREALRTVWQAYCDAQDQDQDVAGAATHMSDYDARTLDQWQRTEALLKQFRSASWESMHRKAEALHYAPSRGLLDVATLLTTLEAARPEAQADTDSASPPEKALATWQRTLTLVLSAGRAGGVMGAWEVICASSPPSSPCREASRFALMTLGGRLLCTLLTAARTEPSLGTAQRLLRELAAWVAQVGRPLRLCDGEVSALWLYQLQRRDAKLAANSTSSHVSWQQTWETVVSSLSAHAPPTPAWECGCGYTNRPLPGVASSQSVACASCVNRDLRPFAWECPSCHWVNRTGEAVRGCFQCGSAHPCCPADAGKSEAHGAEQGDVSGARTGTTHHCSHLHCVRVTDGATVTTGAEAVCVNQPAVSPTRADGLLCTDCGHLHSRTTPHGADLNGPPGRTLHLHYCPDCRCATAVALLADAPLVVTGAAGGASRHTRCTHCHGPHAYWRGAFTWQCGCGADNHPSHHHCWACTRDRHDGTGVYTCPECQGEVTVQDEVGPSPSAPHGCTHCHHHHPLCDDAVATARLVQCPSCHRRMPADADACPHCCSTLVRLVRPLLSTEADQPWVCHACGDVHAVRDAATGALASPALTTSAASGPLPQRPRASAVAVAPHGGGALTGEACRSCHVARIPTATWERGQSWACTHCEGATGAASRHDDFSCTRCLQLAPGVPSEEVFFWACAACNEWNPSWMAHCGRLGCHAAQVHSTRARCAYARWECETCGEWSRALPGPRHCEHCGEVNAPPEPATCTATTDVGDRAPRAERQVVPRSPPLPHAGISSEGLGHDIGSPLTQAEQRLNDVETLLLRAARRAPSRTGTVGHQVTSTRDDVAPSEEPATSTLPGTAHTLTTDTAMDGSTSMLAEAAMQP